MRETANLCLQKAHYLADEPGVPGVPLQVQRPFFKEFTVQVRGDAAELAQRLLKAGYHAGLPLGRWYPGMVDCLTVAVTEKRTLAEIDGIVQAVRETLR